MLKARSISCNIVFTLACVRAGFVPISGSGAALQMAKKLATNQHFIFYIP